MRVLRLAREYKLLPCKYINAPRDADVDLLLTMALDVHDNDLLCSCGDYRDQCQTGEGWYEPDDSRVCYKRAALEQFQKDNPEIEPGTLLVMVDTRISKAPERTQRHTGPRKTQAIQDDTLA